jgi:CPA2 family monovalent cation:H+ antiporter-2
MTGGVTELTGLALVMGVALLCGYAMRRLRQPEIVGYILAGVLLGPSAFGLVKDRENVAFLADLGVLLLMFLVAMELSVKTFARQWRVTVGTVLVQIALAAAFAVAAGQIWGWGWQAGIAMGCVLALSSTAAGIGLLEQTRTVHQPFGQLAVGVLVAQDLAVLPMLLAIALMGKGTLAPLDVAKVALAIALLAGFVWLFARRRVPVPLEKLGKPSQEFLALTGLAFCFGAAALTGLAGLSPVLGAFLAGLAIGSSTARPALLHATRPILGVLLLVFFLSVGLLIDLDFVRRHLGVVVALLAAVLIVKTAVNIGALRLLGEPWPHAFFAGVVLVPLGEFSIVIARAAQGEGLIGADTAQLLIVVVALTLLAAPLWLLMARRLVRLILLSVSTFGATLEGVEGPRLAAALRWSGRTMRRAVARLRRRPAPPPPGA